MAKAKPLQEPAAPSIALDSVAAHFQRQAAYFQNEALGLAAQVREMDNVIQHQAQQIASLMPSPTATTSVKYSEKQRGSTSVK